MARGGKKVAPTTTTTVNPEAEERIRLKELAFAKNALSRNPVKVGPSTALAPSKTVIKHDGKDVLRKSQRKNRYLFSFPGLLGPISGGKIGELKDLGTKNPILYLDFPQGQMKLFGTITFPENRYLTLQFSKGGKNVTCDDYFDNMVVFSDAWWIGKKDENPDELQLEFPEELKMEKQAESDFKGGIGVPCDRKDVSARIPKRVVEESPELDLEDDITDTDSPDDLKESAAPAGLTPTRQSSRTAGKTFRFAEASSGDDFTGNEAEISEEDDDTLDETKRNETCTDTQSEGLSPKKLDFEESDATNEDPASEKNKPSTKTKDPSNVDCAPLVQTTLSTLFKKVEEKKTQKDVKKKTDNSEASKPGTARKKTEKKEAGTVLKEKKKQVKNTKSVDSVAVDKKKPKGKAAGTSSSRKRKADSVSTSQSSDRIDSSQIEDDIEEFSSASASQDMEESDEDWTS